MAMNHEDNLIPSYEKLKNELEFAKEDLRLAEIAFRSARTKMIYAKTYINNLNMKLNLSQSGYSEDDKKIDADKDDKLTEG
jgi:hypothetical protein